VHGFLRRAAFFIFPLIFIAGVLTLLIYSFPEKRGPVPVTKVTAGRVDAKQAQSEGAAKTAGLAGQQVQPQGSYITVVLDPTHGGDDTGSIGVNSVMESHINLQVAFKLARALRMKGMKVFLTRMDDYNVPMDKRFKDAEKQSPSVYISINCAYSANKNMNGMKVYGFSPEPSGDELEKANNKFYEFFEGVYVQRSEDAENVEDTVSASIKKEFNLSHRSTLDRHFLKALALPAGVPALAVFVGYISNWDDARSLSSEKQVDEWAEKFALAIEDSLTRKILTGSEQGRN
jgi:N-acetylmuramoyl-L-alanine amidase